MSRKLQYPVETTWVSLQDYWVSLQTLFVARLRGSFWRLYVSQPVVYASQPLNTQLTRGTRVSLVLSFIGGVHIGATALCPKFDMVLLYRSPIPVGRKGVISSFKLFLPAFPRIERGRGSAPCGLWRLHVDQPAYNTRFSQEALH